MTLTVLKAGLQSSLQAAPYRGLRKLAVPSGGAADGLSLALANRLVGRPLDAAAIEITLGPAEFRADRALAVAVTGAPCQVQINGEEAEPHQTLHLKAGDVLSRDELDGLVAAVLTMDANQKTCPHGRSTTWRISIDEANRMFDRP